MIKSIVPELVVQDVTKSINFYSQNLGFQFVMGVDENTQTDDKFDDSKKYIWSMITQSGSNIMLIDKNSMTEELPEFANKQIGGTMCLYIIVEEIEKIISNFDSRVIVASELHQTFYDTKEIIIKDPDNYYIYLSQENKTI